MSPSESRSKKALKNIISSFSQELVALACGLILPRIVLTQFGSSYNGILSSATQFISCISLMKAGIGGVTRASLYKPLAKKDYAEISAIMQQTERFMRRIALIFVGFSFFLAVVYPLFINSEFDFLFSFSLILIISFSTFIQYYFGLSCQMILIADQRQDIIAYVGICSTIANTIFSVILINWGGTIHLVKAASAIVYAAGPLFLNYYTKKAYHIQPTKRSNTDYLKQRWDAVGHEVANFINSNTDIMVLTVFSGLREVSVYTVYAYVITSIRSVVVHFITGFGAAFGNMYVKNEVNTMRENAKIYELIVFSLASVVYATTLVMITPFALLYTRGVHDAEYSRPLFGALLTLAGAFSCYRIPYETIVKACGHFRQTRNQAFFEAIINIVLSVLFVIRFGLVGVTVGTLVAAIYRSSQFAYYLSNTIIPRPYRMYWIHVLVSLGIILCTYFLSLPLVRNVPTVGAWILKATITCLIAIALTFVTDYFLYRKELQKLFSRLWLLLSHRK